MWMNGLINCYSPFSKGFTQKPESQFEDLKILSFLVLIFHLSHEALNIIIQNFIQELINGTKESRTNPRRNVLPVHFIMWTLTKAKRYCQRQK